MTDLENQSLVLRKLFGLTRGSAPVVERIHVAARLNDAELLGGTNARNTFVFIPDLHLLSRQGEAKYRYTFRSAGAGLVTRDRIFDRLGTILLSARRELEDQGRRLEVVQLGDFVDLWREDIEYEFEIDSLVDEILANNDEVAARMLDPGPKFLDPKILFGNHEEFGRSDVSDSKILKGARLAHVLSAGSGDCVLATHGHQMDLTERLVESRTQAALVSHFGPQAAPSAYRLDRSRERADTELKSMPQGGPPVTLLSADDVIAPWVNVWVTQKRDLKEMRKRHNLLYDAFVDAAGMRRGTRKTMKRYGLGSRASLPRLRTVVVGHSHCARIMVHRHQGNQEAFNVVLADCGAWIENCWFRTKADLRPSCQIGVLSGSDLRIYQLDPARS